MTILTTNYHVKTKKKQKMPKQLFRESKKS